MIWVAAFLLANVAAVPILLALGNTDLGRVTAGGIGYLLSCAVVIVWFQTSHPRWREILGFPRRAELWREVRAGVGFALVLYPSVVLGVGIVIELLLSLVTGELVRAPEQVPPDPSVVVAGVTVVGAIVIAPINEELIFRAAIFRAVRDRYGFRPGLLATGVSFAVSHFFIDAPWQNAVLLVGVMFFNGMALAWWYERRGTILAPIVAHVVFNVIGLTLIYTLR